MAKTGDAEFTLAISSVNLDSARNFADRLCRAIANANLSQDEQLTIVASCGLVSLCQHRGDASSSSGPTLNALWDIAHRRALLGLYHGVPGVVAAEEETSLMQRTG
jgi:two-component system cell cycle response regulator